MKNGAKHGNSPVRGCCCSCSAADSSLDANATTTSNAASQPSDLIPSSSCHCCFHVSPKEEPVTPQEEGSVPTRRLPAEFDASSAPIASKDSSKSQAEKELNEKRTTSTHHLPTLNHFTFIFIFVVFVFSTLYISPTTATYTLPKNRLKSSEDSPVISFEKIMSKDRLKRDASNDSLSSSFDDSSEEEAANTMPTVLVHFQRMISFSTSDNVFSRIPDVGQNEVFTVVESDFPVTLKCHAELHPYFWPDNSTNIKLNVSWVDANSRVLSPNDVLVLKRLDSQSDCRCMANIPLLEKIVAGRLLSRAVKFKTQTVQTFTVEPTISNVSNGGYGRFVCTVNNKNSSEKIIWLKDGWKLKESERIRIFSTDRESILHILNVSTADQGSYKCEFEETTPFFATSVAKLNVELSNATTTEGPKLFVITPPSIIYVKESSDTIVECLFPTSKAKTVWFRIENQDEEITTRHYIGSDSAYVFRQATSADQGEYVCEAREESGIHYQNVFKLEVYDFDEATIDYEDEIFNNVTKKQGTPFKLLCSVYSQLDESPDMASWYKDGEQLTPLPRHKITKVTQGIAPGLVLLISIVEASDQGIYQCIVRKGNAERLQQTALAVEVTTNETLSNFIVVIDHVKACFNLYFDVPKSVDPNYARLATYFLVYYNSNNASSLNSVPLSSASCYNNRTCTLSCCSPNFSFKHATAYTLRISMVLSEEGSVITPLSEPVYVTSWDASATKGLEMDVLYLEQSQELLIKWQGAPPGSIEGTIQKYVLEMLNATRRSAFHLSTLPKVSINLSKDDYLYVLTNITRPFSYRMRIIPITRAGFPPSFALESMENFGFILYTSSDDEIGSPTNSDLESPPIQVAQLENKPVLKVDWKVPNEIGKGANRITKIAIKYQHLLKPKRLFGPIELPVSDTNVQLFKNVESGEMYQVCASYITSSNGAHGFWRCITTPVRDANGKLNHYIEEEDNVPDELPLPVVCEDADCRCNESPEIKGSMRVYWDPPKIQFEPDDEDGEEEKGAEEDESHAKIYTPANYIVHYTLNETDPNGEDFMTQVPPNKFYVDLPILLPNTTYRIMIEAQNENGAGVDGTFFSCTTPPGAELPAPKRLEYYAINETAAMVEWEPLKLNKNSTIADGYTLYFQQGGLSIQDRFIKGSEVNSTILSNLTTDNIYEVYIASHSAQTGTSRLQSAKIIIKLPGDLNKKRHAPVPVYETEEFKATILLSLLCVTVLLCCCLGTICAYFKCQKSGKYKRIWSWCTNKRRSTNEEMTELQVLPQLPLHSIPRTNIGPDAPPSTGRTTLPSIPEIDQETEHLIVMSSPKIVDSKGGPGGFRPRGYRRYQQLVSDPEFLHLITELNQEPIVSNPEEGNRAKSSTEPEITLCPLPTSGEERKNDGNSAENVPLIASSGFHDLSTVSPPVVHSVVTAEVHDDPTDDDINLSSNEADFDPRLSDVPSINTSEHAQSPRAVSFEFLQSQHRTNGNRSESIIDALRSKSSSALNHFFDRNFFNKFHPSYLQQSLIRQEATSPTTDGTVHENDSDSHSLFENHKQQPGRHNNWHSIPNTAALPVSAPASSLPNLTDSGIVFDDLHGGGGGGGTNGYGTTSSKITANDPIDFDDDGSGKSMICHSDSRLVFVPLPSMLSPPKPTAAESACTTFDLASLFDDPTTKKTNGHRRPNGLRLNSMGM